MPSNPLMISLLIVPLMVSAFSVPLISSANAAAHTVFTIILLYLFWIKSISNSTKDMDPNIDNK
ncbi:MAG TPA: hypothetical protein VF242_00285 [Nitrososphaeraceae archaeon]